MALIVDSLREPLANAMHGTQALCGTGTMQALGYFVGTVGTTPMQALGHFVGSVGTTLMQALGHVKGAVSTTHMSACRHHMQYTGTTRRYAGTMQALRHFVGATLVEGTTGTMQHYVATTAIL